MKQIIACLTHLLADRKECNNLSDIIYFLFIPSSSFASFYIDEDDFENENVMTSKSKKPSKEEVFGLAEKYVYFRFISGFYCFRYESDSDSKSNAFESSSSDSDEFEIVASTKKKANSVKKSVNFNYESY